MATITFQFNQRKAIEAVLYLSRRVTESDVYGICKLLYLVDKVSLERYGRFVFGESYVAMKHGATPSNVYDLLKQAEQEPLNELRVEGVQVISLRDANLDYLSKSDVECLDQIISKYGKVTNLDRRRDAHDDAWKKAWEKRGTKGSVKMTVESIAKTLKDSDNLINYLSDSDCNA